LGKYFEGDIYQLVELYHTILLALESKQFTSVTFAYISKAFDTVWIKGLLKFY
jgi:hypothetical protein